MRRLTALLGLALALGTPAKAADYVQSESSSLTFASRYQGEVFTGRFPAFTARLRFDPQQLATSTLDVAIPLAGVTTRNSDRDATLQSADFFYTTKFPQARFTANRFRSLGGNRYAADGILNLRGLSRPVTLAFTWQSGAQPVLTGKATVKRLEFNVGGGDWADTDLLPNDVAISTKVVFTPAK